MVGPYIKFISNSSLMTIFIRIFCRAIFLIILDILINIFFLLKSISSHFFFYLTSLNLYFPIELEKTSKISVVILNDLSYQSVVLISFTSSSHNTVTPSLNPKSSSNPFKSNSPKNS